MKPHTIKAREIIKTVLFTFVTVVLLMSAIGKFMGRDTIVSLFANCGMEDYIIRIAVIQLIIVACLLIKPLRSLGVLVGSAFLGGIIFMIISCGENPLSAGITLLALWVAYKLEWWGYWNHHTPGEKCGCGWCERSKHVEHHDFPTTCTCKEDVCKC